MEKKKAVVVGGGMAGCEAAQIIASYGIDVDLYEQKPVNFSAAHKTEGLAELVCSNSLKASCFLFRTSEGRDAAFGQYAGSRR